MDVMKEVMTDVIQTYQQYNGSGLYLGIYFCGLLFLFLTEKEKGKRVILLYASLCLFGLFFFPGFAYVMIKLVFDAEVYYRILWMLPVYIVVAYSAVRIVNMQKAKLQKIIVGIMVCLVLMVAGDYAYDHPIFEKAENLYKLPQNVINICDEIKPDEGEPWIMAVFPKEMVSYVRQYTTTIHMPYGRNMLIERWGFQNPLYEAMEAEEIDTKVLTQLAREYACDYIVLYEKRAKTASFDKYYFNKIATIDGYCIYKDELISE